MEELPLCAVRVTRSWRSTEGRVPRACQDHQEGHAVHRGWLAAVGLVVAAIALYTLLASGPVGDGSQGGQEIDERSRQDLRELLREAEGSG